MKKNDEKKNGEEEKIKEKEVVDGLENGYDKKGQENGNIDAENGNNNGGQRQTLVFLGPKFISTENGMGN